MDEWDGIVEQLRGEGLGDSAVFDRWIERLWPYIQAQGTETVRERVMPETPWPAADNIMLAYLIERAIELQLMEDNRAATVWLAVHAWFEGALDRDHAYVNEGWWHLNVLGGQVHEHTPRQPATMHRQCEPVYTRRQP